MSIGCFIIIWTILSIVVNTISYLNDNDKERHACQITIDRINSLSISEARDRVYAILEHQQEITVERSVCSTEGNMPDHLRRLFADYSFIRDQDGLELDCGNIEPSDIDSSLWVIGHDYDGAEICIRQDDDHVYILNYNIVQLLIDEGKTFDEILVLSSYKSIFHLLLCIWESDNELNQE